MNEDHHPVGRPFGGRAMTVDTAELRKRAEEATKGPWMAEASIYENMAVGLRALPEDRGFAQLWQHPNVMSDAQYIVAAQPQVVLALLDRIEEMEASLRKISSPTQTENLLWWQIEARKALSGEKP